MNIVLLLLVGLGDDGPGSTTANEIAWDDGDFMAWDEGEFVAWDD